MRLVGGCCKGGFSQWICCCKPSPLEYKNEKDIPCVVSSSSQTVIVWAKCKLLSLPRSVSLSPFIGRNCSVLSLWQPRKCSERNDDYRRIYLAHLSVHGDWLNWTWIYYCLEQPSRSDFLIYLIVILGWGALYSIRPSCLLSAFPSSNYHRTLESSSFQQYVSSCVCQWRSLTTTTNPRPHLEKGHSIWERNSLWLARWGGWPPHASELFGKIIYLERRTTNDDTDASFWPRNIQCQCDNSSVTNILILGHFWALSVAGARTGRSQKYKIILECGSAEPASPRHSQTTRLWVKPSPCLKSLKIYWRQLEEEAAATEALCTWSGGIQTELIRYTIAPLLLHIPTPGCGCFLLGG